MIPPINSILVYLQFIMADHIKTMQSYTMMEVTSEVTVTNVGSGTLLEVKTWN